MKRKKLESLLALKDKLLAILDSSGDAILVLDPSGKSIFANRKFKMLWEIPEEKFGPTSGKHLEALFKSRLSDLKKIHKLTRNRKKKGPREGVSPVKFSDGTAYELHFCPWTYNNKELGRIIFLRDKKKTGKDSKAAKNAFRSLLASSPEAILMLNPDGTIRWMSDVAPALLRTEVKEKLKGKPFWDFVIPGERKKIRSFFNENIADSQVRDIETTLVKNDQSTFLARISHTAIRQDSKPGSCMILIRDLTPSDNLDIKLIHNARLLSLGEMATGIAHEINQPLNTISITMDNILYEINKCETIDKPYFKTKSDKIFDNIYRIRDIIEHIRDFSQHQDDRKMVPFDLRKGITSAISMVSEEFRSREIDLVTDLDKSDCRVLGNVYKFEQVILNLLANSKDALEDKKKNASDEIRSYVRIHAFSRKKYTYVAVEDNGPGIPADELDKILMPFYSTKEVGKGAGLGLSISYGIIREMNGTFEVQSKPGVGTTVLMRLPLVKQETEPSSEPEVVLYP